MSRGLIVPPRGDLQELLPSSDPMLDLTRSNLLFDAFTQWRRFGIAFSAWPSFEDLSDRMMLVDGELASALRCERGSLAWILGSRYSDTWARY